MKLVPEPEIAKHLGFAEPGELEGPKIDRAVDRLVDWLGELKAQLGIPASIQAAGVAEADFLAQVDRIAVEAFDDQCTGANPRFPLISELRTLLLDSYYGRAFSEPMERIVAVVPEAIAAPRKGARKAANAAAE